MMQLQFIRQQGAIMQNDAIEAAARPEVPFAVAINEALEALAIEDTDSPECAAWQAAERVALEPHGAVTFRVSRGNVRLHMDHGVMRFFFAPVLAAAAACAPPALAP